MNITIKNEFYEFRKYHINIYNIFFHILCGFFFISFLFSSAKKYSIILLFLYMFLLLLIINNVVLISSIFIILFLIIFSIKKCKFSSKQTVLLALFFYFLPEVSHYFTNEPTYLSFSNINLKSFFENVFYFLPFSILCLSNSK